MELGISYHLRMVRRKWQPTPVLLPRKSHGRRTLLQATIHGVTRAGQDWATSLQDGMKQIHLIVETVFLELDLTCSDV